MNNFFKKKCLTDLKVLNVMHHFYLQKQQYLSEKAMYYFSCKLKQPYTVRTKTFYSFIISRRIINHIRVYVAFSPEVVVQRS